LTSETSNPFSTRPSTSQYQFVSRLDRDAQERLPNRLELTHDSLEPIRESLVEHDPILVVEDHHAVVPGMKVDSAVQ
jgi:hypothetical protein